MYEEVLTRKVTDGVELVTVNKSNHWDRHKNNIETFEVSGIHSKCHQNCTLTADSRQSLDMQGEGMLWSPRDQ